MDSPPKRKHTPDLDYPPAQTRDPPPPKRPRTSDQNITTEQPRKAESASNADIVDPLKSWVLEQKWPKEYFQQGSETGKDLFDHDSWLEEQKAQPPPPTIQYVEINGFRYPRPNRMGATSLDRKQSGSSLTGSSDKERENRSGPYRDARYITLLAAKGSFLRDFDDDDPPKTIMDIGQKLLNREQSVPHNSLFRDDLFRRLCRETENRNEAMIIQDISRLLVPSAKNLAIYGDSHLNFLIENVNESWTECIPVEGPRPQPDYSVGFRRSAFTDQQLNKLDPIVGSVFDTSFFVATYQMYLPFLTCEVKCGTAALDVADRQNAHSMTIAVRGVVELYRAVKREKELNQIILAFSVSHDHSAINIYGHYPVIDGSKTTYHRHTIKKFDFTSEGGTDKWTAYKFTRNVYDIWMPTHLKRICSAIDQLPPNLNFQVC